MVYCRDQMNFFLGLFFLVSGTLFASPIGNPSFPKLVQKGIFTPCDSWASLRAGYEGDFVQDARLTQESPCSGRVDCFQQGTNALSVTLNVVERLDLYGLYGSSRVQTSWRFTTPLFAVHRAQLETRHRSLWGVGARGILYEWGCASLGLGGRYSQSHPKPSWMTMDGAPLSTKGMRMEWSEWQVDLDLSYEIDLLIPYIGVKYALQKVTIAHATTSIANNNETFIGMKSFEPVGLVIGCGLSAGKCFFLNVEGRLIGEDALTLSGDAKF